MPTDRQIAVARGIHPVTEAFATDIYLNAAGKLDGIALPPGAWEDTSDEARALCRDKARDWIDRALVGAVGLEDYRKRGPGVL